MGLQLPSEFENIMKVRLGPDYTDFCDALNHPTPVSIRYNPAKSEAPAGDSVPWCRSGRYLENRPSFTLDPSFHAGKYYVQEASSMFLEQAIPASGQPLNVLDLCAAPGGKSTHLLSLLPSGSLLVSNEVIRSRASVLSENIQKWGQDNVIVTNNDPADFGRLAGFFDIILVDAPCSGEGLFRKEPEAMNEWSVKNTELCTLRQRRIVSDVWPALKPGGLLIYSTCTYNENENINNLKWIRSTHGAECIDIPLKKDWNIATIKKNEITGYQLFPHRVKGEGFFISVLQKHEDLTSKIKTKDILQYPSSVQVKDISSWILHPDEKSFFMHNQTIRMIPSAKRYELQTILYYLNVVLAGTGIAEITKNKYIPDHSLALSIHIDRKNFNSTSLNKADALEYLRKNNFNLDLSTLGFTLMEYDGLPLGWVNIIQNRFNNLYPATWRIRMGHEAPR